MERGFEPFDAVPGSYSAIAILMTLIKDNLVEFRRYVVYKHLPQSNPGLIVAILVSIILDDWRPRIINDFRWFLEDRISIEAIIA